MALSGLQMQAQTLDDVLQYVPAAAAVGLDFCGTAASHELRERIALTATAFTALTVVTGSLKLAVSERRPDGSDYNSFPSGHAARAFMGAELVRSEYGWQWGVGAYAVAAGVAALRVTGDCHYLHDVVAGAAVGVLSARFAYWLLPYERRLLGWDKDKVSVSALPAYDYGNRAFGVALTATLP